MDQWTSSFSEFWPYRNFLRSNRSDGQLVEVGFHWFPAQWVTSFLRQNRRSLSSGNLPKWCFPCKDQSYVAEGGRKKHESWPFFEQAIHPQILPVPNWKLLPFGSNMQGEFFWGVVPCKQSSTHESSDVFLWDFRGRLPQPKGVAVFFFAFQISLGHWRVCGIHLS